MTPSTAKPETSSFGDSDASETDITPVTDADDAAAGAAAKASVPRRRAAALELRMAGRRAATDPDEADSAAKGARTGRSPAGGGPRTGPRAQQRAAKAAQADDLSPTYAEFTDLPNDADNAPIGADTTTVPYVAEMPRPAAPLPAAPLLPAPHAERPQTEILPDEDDQGGDERGPGGGNRRRMGPRAEKRAAREAKNNDAAHYVVAPTVNMAQMRPRHYGVIALFVLMVVLPTLSYSWYLWTKAADQYESNVGFGSRTEDAPSTFDFLGALGGVSQNGSKDMDILNQFIISQELVAKVDRELDLKAIYSKARDDPLNAFTSKGTIEDLLSYWQRKVIVNYDTGTGLMTLQVFAFSPEDARNIAKIILVESTKIINDLSMTAQEDTTRYSKDALTTAEKKLGDARLAVLDYQIANRIVDPTNVIATQNGVISTLNQQLATAQIDLDMLAGTVGKNDLRINTLNRRIEVIQNRIAEEQAKVGGASDSSAPGFAKLMQDFERLKVDQDFSERAYLAALAAYDQAINDAQHKTRYLATYVAPTLAEAPTAPNRPLTAVVVALIGFLLWSILVLLYYALRDRR